MVSMTLQRIVLAWVAVLALLASGPGLAADRNVRVEPGTGLSFGAFDITESDLAATHVVLMRIKPARMYMGSSGEKATVTYANREFYSANLAPGPYTVNGFFSSNKFFALERNLRTNTFQVEPGRAAYAGSYKLVLAKGGLFRRDKGTFDRVDSPDQEVRLLRWLGQELKGTGWAPAVAARAAERAGK